MSQALQRPRAASILITFAAFVVVVAGLRAAEPIVVPFLLSVFLAIISAPPLFWLENRGLPKWLAMLTVITGIVAVAFGITALLGNSINDFSRDIPFYKTRLKEQFGGLVTWLSAHGLQVT
ncbi:MAG TPA: AI-2E family transporter, partial [Gammaproteobacteria bacterium]|nr:AI-2E family transporter [Gammaproteobacteria bacterium]